MTEPAPDAIPEVLPAPAEPGAVAAPEPLAPMAPPAAEALPPAEPLDPPTLPPPAAPASNLPSYILWGAGGASLIVGSIFGIAAISAKGDFDDEPTTAHADSVHDHAIASDVGFGLGLVLGITGTVFYFLADAPAEQAGSQPAAHAKPKTRPAFTSRAGGGALTLHF